MTDPLRRQLLDAFTGRTTRRCGLGVVNQLPHALQAAGAAWLARHFAPDVVKLSPAGFDHFLRHVETCRLK